MEGSSLENDKKLPFGIGCLDTFFEGGVEKGVITQVYGEGGTGKTNMALQLTVSALLTGKRVIYIDTEGFSSTRFLQIANNDQNLSKNLLLFRCETFGEQEMNLIKSERILQNSKDVDLLVLDSITALLRIERDDNVRNQGLSRVISLLHTIGSKYSIPLFITNQIYFDVTSSTITPFGGHLLDHFSKTIISLKKMSNGGREATVEKHRSIKDGKTQIFYIGQTGINCFP